MNLSTFKHHELMLIYEALQRLLVIDEAPMKAKILTRIEKELALRGWSRDQQNTDELEQLYLVKVHDDIYLAKKVPAAMYGIKDVKKDLDELVWSEYRTTAFLGEVGQEITAFPVDKFFKNIEK
jgi:hypothetical protein